LDQEYGFKKHFCLKDNTNNKKMVKCSSKKYLDKYRDNLRLLDESQRLVISWFKERHGLLFLSGEAGSGKSFALSVAIQGWLCCNYVDTIAVISATKTASINLCGRTIHSLFDVDYREEIEDINLYEHSQKLQNTPRIKYLKKLIIEEVSLLSSYALDKIDILFRIMRNKDVRFGGIDVILCGDPLQLRSISENKKKKNGYKDKLFSFFKADCLKENYDAIFLKKNHRIGGENTFMRILNKCRRNEHDSNDLSYLNHNIGSAVNKQSIKRISGLLKSINKKLIDDTPHMNNKASFIRDVERLGKNNYKIYGDIAILNSENENRQQIPLVVTSEKNPKRKYWGLW
jgi:hypothetical protein